MVRNDSHTDNHEKQKLLNKGREQQRRRDRINISHGVGPAVAEIDPQFAHARVGSGAQEIK